MSTPLAASQAPLLVVGAGAVGAYLAGHLAAAGEPVVVLEPWDPNRQAIRTQGLRIDEPSGRLEMRLRLIDTVEEIASVAPGLVVLCTKLADAPATVERIETVYRGPYLVTLNALADLDLAEQLGADRVMGCIVTGLFANLVGPGTVRRHRRRLDGGAPTFRLGETAGPAGPRLRALATTLGQVDRAEVVDDLPAARWTKMVFNCMTSPLSALHRRPIRDLFLDPDLRAEMTRVGLEVAAAAGAAGMRLNTLCGVPGATWLAAARQEPTALAALDVGLVRYGGALDSGATSGMAQDLARGRRTEVSLINGAVVERAARLGLAAPANAALVTALEAAVPA
ncbi:ketopantoate reductase C-terminal domain-containing protein [Pararoseomonas sp. SCSIO 73927]|uniref:ketopantoate reductase family protein n=1 Tax=Pararoseomonas sp. SCSIO 73927 TaxID=3114537 RepID=UPI0030D2C366